jgi:hypothetical protein
MEKYNTRRSLGSYSIDRQLIMNLEGFINTKIPRLLDLDWHVGSFSNHCTLTLVGSKDSTIFTPVHTYSQPQFSNDIQTLRIELQFVDENGPRPASGIVLLVRLGNCSEDSELSVALRTEKAEAKARAIEEGILAILEPNKNRNRIVYPNEFIPTLVFVIGFFSGAGVLMFSSPLLRSLCILLLGAAIYLVARRFTKGYCSFHSRRQRQLDILFRWLTAGVVVFVLSAVIINLR